MEVNGNHDANRSNVLASDTVSEEDIVPGAGHSSNESVCGLSDAATAVVSDTDGCGQVIGSRVHRIEGRPASNASISHGTAHGSTQEKVEGIHDTSLSTLSSLTSSSDEHNATVIRNIKLSKDGHEHSEMERITCTPSEHIPSLHLSQKVLVSETMSDSDSDDIVPPSQDEYAAPIIIPSSPTASQEDPDVTILEETERPDSCVIPTSSSRVPQPPSTTSSPAGSRPPSAFQQWQPSLPLTTSWRSSNSEKPNGNSSPNTKQPLSGTSAKKSQASLNESSASDVVIISPQTEDRRSILMETDELQPSKDSLLKEKEQEQEENWTLHLSQSQSVTNERISQAQHLSEEPEQRIGLTLDMIDTQEEDNGQESGPRFHLDRPAVQQSENLSPPADQTSIFTKLKEATVLLNESTDSKEDSLLIKDRPKSPWRKKLEKRIKGKDSQEVGKSSITDTIEMDEGPEDNQEEEKVATAPAVEEGVDNSQGSSSPKRKRRRRNDGDDMTATQEEAAPSSVKETVTTVTADTSTDKGLVDKGKKGGRKGKSGATKDSETGTPKRRVPKSKTSKKAQKKETTTKTPDKTVSADPYQFHATQSQPASVSIKGTQQHTAITSKTTKDNVSNTDKPTAGPSGTGPVKAGTKKTNEPTEEHPIMEKITTETYITKRVVTKEVFSGDNVLSSESFTILEPIVEKTVAFFRQYIVQAVSEEQQHHQRTQSSPSSANTTISPTRGSSLASGELGDVSSFSKSSTKSSLGSSKSIGSLEHGLTISKSASGLGDFVVSPPHTGIFTHPIGVTTVRSSEILPSLSSALVTSTNAAKTPSTGSSSGAKHRDCAMFSPERPSEMQSVTIETAVHTHPHRPGTSNSVYTPDVSSIHTPTISKPASEEKSSENSSSVKIHSESLFTSPDLEKQATKSSSLSDAKQSASLFTSPERKSDSVSTTHSLGSRSLSSTKQSASLFTSPELKKTDSTSTTSDTRSLGSRTSTRHSASLFDTSPELRKSSTTDSHSLGSRAPSMDDVHFIRPEVPAKKTGGKPDTVVPAEAGTSGSKQTEQKDKQSGEKLFETGTRVLGKWKDGYYYPGQIICIEKRNKFSILFDDGDQREVKVTDLIICDFLDKNRSVLAEAEDGMFYSGIIVNTYSEGDEHGYVVEQDDGTHQRFARSKVILTGAQAVGLVSGELGPTTPIPSDKACISLDNLVEGRRTSLSSGSKPSTSAKKDPTLISGGKAKKRQAPRSTSTPTPKRLRSRIASLKDEVGGTPSPIQNISTSPKSKGKALESPRKASKELFGVKGPLPEDHHLFLGLAFLLTHLEKTDNEKNYEKKILDISVTTDESSVEEEPTVPFDKNHLRTQIETGEGVVLDKFNPQQVSQCLLVSDTHHRTEKYLHCLAANIPCVSHMWVIDCCRLNKRLEFKKYLLPAGISIEKKVMVEWKTQRERPLAQQRVLLISKKQEVLNTWTSILEAAQCIVVLKIPSGKLQQDLDNKLKICVADDTLTTAQKHRLGQMQVPVVSSEWVIQTLITGQEATIDGHDKYRHDYKDPPSL